MKITLNRAARPLTSAVAVLSEDLLDAARDLRVLTVPCADYDALDRLPGAVEYEGRVYGRTGWNSDRFVAYYRTDARVAFAR